MKTFFLVDDNGFSGGDYDVPVNGDITTVRFKRIESIHDENVDLLENTFLFRANCDVWVDIEGGMHCVWIASGIYLLFPKEPHEWNLNYGLPNGSIGIYDTHTLDVKPTYFQLVNTNTFNPGLGRTHMAVLKDRIYRTLKQQYGFPDLLSFSDKNDILKLSSAVDGFINDIPASDSVQLDSHHHIGWYVTNICPGVMRTTSFNMDPEEETMSVIDDNVKTFAFSIDDFPNKDELLEKVAAYREKRTVMKEG